jgi:hypothetical protein
MRGYLTLVCAGLGLLAGCAVPPAGAPPIEPHVNAPQGWIAQRLPGQQPGIGSVAFHRQALVQPTRYRVVVIPGSGCTRWAPIADRFFAGLLHADVVALHKPYVDVMGAQGDSCSPTFVATDSLPFWRDAAVAAVAALPRDPERELPTVVVGISEGAEVLLDVARSLPAVAALVMVSASGLDPAMAGAMQAQRIGQTRAWQTLGAMQSSDQPDGALVQGRTLRYWRTFWHWSLSTPLLTSPWPLLRIWGDADELVPLDAYLQFNQLALNSQAVFCDLRLPGADHGLQTRQRDGIQWLWSQLERWARQPGSPICDVVAVP